MSVWQRLTTWGREMAGRVRAVVRIWANPVVVRDIRVRMRGARSYVQLAVYLGLLICLTLAGYATATTSGMFGSGHTAAHVQAQLQAMYYFIFITLAALVCFIAPALTASSITTERQRLTIDLLVTTPLTSSELLVGKLVSSVAFLTLLLLMSLPASALCVILGGATLGDVFSVYILLAIDGLVLSAVGLYYSCTSKNSMNAIVATYGTVLMLLWFSSAVVPFTIVSRMTGHTDANPLMAVAALNPIVAVSGGTGAFELAGLSIPLWTITALVAVLMIRLLVTGATYRMGSYGTDAIGSLRRQILFLTGVAAFVVVYGILYGTGFSRGSMVAHAGPTNALVPGVIEYTMIGAFAVAAFFMPALFTPESAEDAAPGEPVDGSYDMRRAFRPVHAGALPYFHLWLGSLAAGALVAALLAGVFGQADLRWPVLVRVLLTALYLSGAATLFWALARRVATLVPGLSAARALAFGAEVALAAMPVMMVAMADAMLDITDSAYSVVWIFYPVVKPEPGEAEWALATTAGLTYLVSILVFPFWKKVVTAGVRYWGARSTA